MSVRLMTNAAGSLSGSLFYVAPGVWKRLEQISWDGQTLQFRHTAGSGVPATRFMGTRQGNSLSGTFQRGTASGSWSANRFLLHGFWRGSGTLRLFQINRLEGASSQIAVRKLLTSPGQSSSTLTTATWDGTTLTMKDGTRTFTSKLVGGRLVGSVKTTGTSGSVGWSADRQPDGLPL
jgi:hypothetical protein